MARSKAMQLLLVEDNRGDAMLAQVQLREPPTFDFDLITASRLQDAIEITRQQPIDGVILDLNLPDSAGIETLRRLRAANDDVAVIVLTGDDSSDLRHLVIAEGAYDFISKAETSDRLLARSVLYALERHRVQMLHRQVRQLVAATPDAVIVVDGENVVRFVNPAAEELFGVQEEALIGDHLGFSIRDGQAQEVEIIRDGEVLQAEIRVAGIEWAGAPGLLVSIRDVTEQRKLAEQLRQAQRLEAIGLLAGGVAHDLNNLLVVMMCCADMLGVVEKDAAGAPPVDVSELAEELMQVTQRARALTSQLLLLAGNRPSNPQPVDLNEAVREIYKLLRRTLPESIELVVLPHEDLWPVLVDQGQLGQVVLNLAVNARDAMPGSGRLEIALANTRLDQAAHGLPAGDYAAMRVSDTGTGITADQLERIFEPFFTTKEQGKGTGLGLATSRSILRQAGGDMLVDSEVGRGTTFTVLLPRTDAVPPAVGPDSGDRRRFDGSESIMVVEDDPAVARLMTAILRNHGYAVTAAANGDEARRLIPSIAGSLRLVITDVVMPQLGGRELADWMEQAHPEVRVLLVSGYAEEPPSPQGRPRQILPKPFLPRELLTSVRQLLDA